MPSDAWRKAPAELIERFHAAVAGIDGLEVRPMFGYPAAFIGGNMTAGLYQETFLVRLPEAERADRHADGWATFEPMPGRPMREYVALPAEAVADPAATPDWVERPASYARPPPPQSPDPPQP